MHLNERSYMMQQKESTQDFPGASVVGNPPANAVYMGLIPDAGGSHMPQSNEAHVPQLLRLCSRAQEPQLLSPRDTATEPHLPRAHARHQENPLQWATCPPQLEVVLALCS